MDLKAVYLIYAVQCGNHANEVLMEVFMQGKFSL